MGAKTEDTTVVKTTVSSVTEVALGNGSYRPLFEIGRGGMARVYLAERYTKGICKLVVLKILDPLLAASEEMRAAFRREAVLCARLNHPNIVHAFEVHDDIATPLIVMEYVEGVSLAEVRKSKNGKVPLRLHIHIIAQTLGALHYFHELKAEGGEAQEPVHRDVSPQNVLVMHEGVVKVLDFGIAKLRGADAGDATKTGTIKGKLAYMPPEQVFGDKTIDRRADIFAAGIMLWEAFAGRRMWQGRQESDIVASVAMGNIPSIREACPSISQTWEAIISKAVAREREGRYSTALEMQVAMEEALSELGGAVAQREVAIFMQTEFGGHRKEQQRRIHAALQGEPLPVSPILAEPRPEDRSFTVTPLSSGHTIGALEQKGNLISPARKLPMTIWGSALVFAALSTVAAVSYSFGISSPSQLSASASVVGEKESPPLGPAEQGVKGAQKLVTLSVVTEPGTATIHFNGRPMGVSPWSAQKPASEEKGYVEVRAPGHLPFAQEVSLKEDVSLSVRLEPEPAKEVEPKPVSQAAPAPTKKAASVRSASPRISAPASRRCSPPYTIDAKGIKTFKPECL